MGSALLIIPKKLFLQSAKIMLEDKEFKMSNEQEKRHSSFHGPSFVKNFDFLLYAYCCYRL